MFKTILAILIATMIFAPMAGAMQANTIEIRGEIQNFTAQSGNITWDPYNFAGFWYDIDDNLGTETLTIENCSLSGAQRTIPEYALVYKTAPMYQDYELYENENLTVESDNTGGDSGYYMEGWMAENYICIDNNADKLVKLLVEFEDDDKKTLATGEVWQLGGGFSLEAQQIDLEGDKVLFQLVKDGTVLDNEVVSTGSSIRQDRVYTYTADIGNEEDIPVFSCYVDAVFRGTSSNIVQVMYVFLMDNDVLEIDTGDSYGVMEVQTASRSGITLKNEDNTIDLDTDSKEHIMGNMYFIIADNEDDATVLRFYPMVEVSMGVPDCPACPEVVESVPCPECPECPEPEPCPEVTPKVIVNETVVYVEVEKEPMKYVPGFEGIMALSGLLMIAYLIVRQKK